MEETKKRYDESLEWLKNMNRNIEPEVVDKLCGVAGTDADPQTPRSLTQRYYQDVMMPVGAGDDMQKVRVSMELPKDWGKVV